MDQENDQPQADERRCSTLEEVPAPDLKRIPLALQSLAWKPMQEIETMELCNGDRFLVAVIEKERHSKGWRYGLSVVTVECDEHYYRVTVDGDDWGLHWGVADWFVKVD